MQRNLSAACVTFFSARMQTCARTCAQNPCLSLEQCCRAFAGSHAKKCHVTSLTFGVWFRLSIYSAVMPCVFIIIFSVAAAIFYYDVSLVTSVPVGNPVPLAVAPWCIMLWLCALPFLLFYGRDTALVWWREPVARGDQWCFTLGQKRRHVIYFSNCDWWTSTCPKIAILTSHLCRTGSGCLYLLGCSR